MSDGDNVFPLYTALLSLVDSDGRPLERMIAAHLAWLKSQGVSGVLVMGTTGSFPNFTVSQRQQYLEAVIRQNPGLTLMVNIGATALPDILALQDHALSQPQVDQILWMPPFYYPGSEINGLPRMLETLLKHQPESVRFYIYHFPRMSQVPVLPELLEAFPRVAGIKDSSGDFDRIRTLVERFPRLAIYAGTDFHAGPARESGCAGIISGMSNVFPGFLSRAMGGETRLQPLLAQLRKTFPVTGKIPAFLAYLNHLQLSPDKAVSMLPFSDLSDSETQALVSALQAVLKQEASHVTG